MAEDGGEEKTSDRTRTVFISYASQDASVANSIVESLEQHGLRCWLAPRDVRPGAQYAEAIVRAINDAEAVVLVLSKSAIASDHVAREVERAASKHKPIIAFRTDSVALNPGLEYFLSNSQWIDVPAIGIPAALEKLTEAVEQGAGHAGAADPVESAKPLARTGGRAKLIAGAAVVITVGVAAALGVHFWWQSHKAAPPAAAVAITDKSIAVLPFVDMSEKKDQEYFSDGLSEELIDMLTKIPELRVPARTSSFYFKGKQATVPDIAKPLSVAHVLEGSVRKSGNHLRITAQLVRADNGYHLWSETYDRQLNDVFKVQEEIARAVVTALKVHLLQAQPVTNSHRTANINAYNQYLLGRNFYLNRPTRDGPHLAVDAYRKAIELDPGYALAYAGLAEAESLAADATNDMKGQDTAMADAERAVALAPDLADAYGARGRLRHVYSWNWVGAQTDFEKALALNPGDSGIQTHYAELLATVGRLPAAVAAARKAVEIDPLSERASRRLGQFLYYDGQIAAARQALGLAFALNPESIYSRWHLGVIELLDGHPQQALDEFRQDKDPVFRLNGVALAEHSLAHAGEARAAMDELIRTNAVQSADYQIAEVYAWRAEKDDAFEWLDRAFAGRDGGLVLVKIDPLLGSLHNDPRYKAFLRRMNLSQ